MKKKKLKSLEFEIIPEHKEYKLDMGTIHTTTEYRGLLKERCFKSVNLQSNDTITITSTIIFDDIPEERNQIKIWLNKLRYKISGLFWDDWE